MQKFLKLSAVPYILFCLLISTIYLLSLFPILLLFCLTCEGIEPCLFFFPVKEQEQQRTEAATGYSVKKDIIATDDDVSEAENVI